MNRSKRKELAEETLAILEKRSYLNSNGEEIDFNIEQDSAEKGTLLYKDERIEDLVEKALSTSPNYNTTFEVNDLTSLSACFKLLDDGFKNIMCLNFASAMNPGGGFLSGSQAQEESLARTSGLYHCLLKASEYYETNRKKESCFYQDYMIYSPNVPFFRNDNCENLDTIKTISIITAPAVNTGAVKKNSPHRVDEIERIMRQRINKVLAISKIHGHKDLVLGAWGCGVFQNDPNDIAKYFKDALHGKFKGHFNKVVFAIYSNNEKFISPFRREFE